MTRSDVYQQVTDRIVAAIEAGTAPWRKPWVGGGPFNMSNGRQYRGINVFLLGLMPYADPRWGTFKACKETAVKHAEAEGREIVKVIQGKRVTYYEIVDGQRVLFTGGVCRDEKATHVILWKPVKRKGADANGAEEDQSYLLLKSFPVFNAQQCEGLPAYIPEEGRQHEPLEAAERIVIEYMPGPTIDHGGDRAAYSETLDYVRMPLPEAFESTDAYYSTLFHELVHSTGHKDRLARLERTGFGTGPYAKEELVAEMGAAMLCGLIGIENLDQSAAYVQNWLGALRDDRKLVVQAAANAQKAVDLMVGATFEDSPVPENREEVLV